MFSRQGAFIVLAILSGLLFAPRFVRAATLSITPQDLSAAPGDTFPVSILFNSKGESVNVIQGTVVYPTELLELVTLSRGGSFLTLWAEEPSADTRSGRVTFVGGIPNGSVVYNAPALSLMFRARTVGKGTIRFDPQHSSVYLNDGAGTQTALTVEGATVDLRNADPLQPVIFSPSHPHEGLWSRERSALLRWTEYPNSFYSFSLSRTSAVDPDEIQEESHGQVSYPSLVDGAWYFSLKQRLPGEGWGSAVHRQLLIDATPPRSLTVTLDHEPAVQRFLLGFTALDDTSGVDHYEVRTLRPRISWIPFFFRGEWQRAVSPVSFPEDDVFSAIDVRAFDAAGNVRETGAVNPALKAQQQRFLVSIAVVLLAFIGLGLLARRMHRQQHFRLPPKK